MMYLCLRCNGTGEYEQARDLHRSGGIVPCSDCSGAGKLDERMYQFLKRLGYRVSEEPLSTRSQAEELLAGRDAVIETQADSIDKLERKVQHWQERAEKVEELLTAERAWAKDRGVLAVKLALENSGLKGKIDTLEADNAAKDARIKELEDYAREATKAITGLTGGGSENFSKEIGDVFTADLPFCLDRIRERYVSKVELKRLEAKLAAAEKALEAIAGYCDMPQQEWREKHPEFAAIMQTGPYRPDTHAERIGKFARAVLGSKP